MKKIIYIIILVSIGFLFAEEVTFGEEFNFSSISKKGSGNLLKKVEGSINEKVDFSKGIIKCGDLKTFSVPLNPVLAQKNIHLEMDGNFDISDVVLVDGNSKKTRFQGKIKPAEQRVQWNENFSKNDKKYSEVYTKDSFYPGKWLSYTAGFDGEKTHIYIHLYPLQWNPISQDLALLNDYSINVLGKEKKIRNVKSSFRSIDSEHILICPEEWKETADSIATFNSELGITTESVTLEEILENYEPAEETTFSGYATDQNNSIFNYQYENARKIISFLRDNDSHLNLELVSILGRGSVIPPAYYFYFPQAEQYMQTYDSWIPSDHYYSSPDYDWVENFGISRVSVATKEELQDYKTKMIKWVDSWDNSWTRKASVAGGVAFESPYIIGELISNHAITNDIFSDFEIDKYYATRDNFSRNDLEHHLQVDNFLWHLHICHGSGSGIHFEDGTSIFATHLKNQYPQKDKLPIFLSVACMNGAFDTEVYSGYWNGDSFAEGMIKSKGAGIAYIGGSRSNGGAAEHNILDGNLSYTGENDTYALLYNFIKSYRELENPTFGELFKNSKDIFLEEENMHIWDQMAYVRFISHANAGLTLPIAPEQTNSTTRPDINLSSPDGFENFYQFITLNSDENPLYQISDDKNYDLESTRLNVYYYNGEFELLNHYNYFNEENVSGNFTQLIDTEEIYLLNKLENEEYKEAWHWSKITKAVGNDDDVNFATQVTASYPNPFKINSANRNSVMKIEFNIDSEKPALTEISVYNVKGQKVKQLLNETLENGNHIVEWNGKNELKEKVGTGVYFYKFKSKNKIELKKFLVLK